MRGDRSGQSMSRSRATLNEMSVSLPGTCEACGRAWNQEVRRLAKGWGTVPTTRGVVPCVFHVRQGGQQRVLSTAQTGKLDTSYAFRAM